MRKKILKKLIKLCEKILGKEETDKIVDKTIKEFVEELKK